MYSPQNTHELLLQTFIGVMDMDMDTSLRHPPGLEGRSQFYSSRK